MSGARSSRPVRRRNQPRGAGTSTAEFQARLMATSGLSAPGLVACARCGLLICDCPDLHWKGVRL